MNTGEKFEKLVKIINENSSYKLNKKGVNMVKRYHDIIFEIENSIKNILKGIVNDTDTISKQSAIQVISMINSTQSGTEDFDIMSRLDSLTNGGKTHISGDIVSFNGNDIILQYIEKI